MKSLKVGCSSLSVPDGMGSLLGSRAGLLDLPSELIIKIASLVSLSDVICLSETCSKLEAVINAGDWVSAVVSARSSRPPVGRVVLCSTSGALIRLSDSPLCGLVFPPTLRFLFIYSSDGVCSGLFMDRAHSWRLEFLVLGGVGPSCCYLESFLVDLTLNPQLRVLVAPEFRGLRLVPVPLLGRLVCSLERVMLPLAGSDVDGITGAQLEYVLSLPGRLANLRLVTYWSMSQFPSVFELQGLMYHLMKQRGALLRRYLKSLAIRNYGGVEVSLPEVDHTCVLRWGSGESPEWTLLSYSLGGVTLPFGDVASSMRDLSVPDGVELEVSQIAWGYVGRVSSIWTDFVPPEVLVGFRVEPSLGPSVVSWNSPVLGRYVDRALPFYHLGDDYPDL